MYPTARPVYNVDFSTNAGGAMNVMRSSRPELAQAMNTVQEKRTTEENLKSYILDTHCSNLAAKELVHSSSLSVLVANNQQHLAELSMTNPDEWRKVMSSHFKLVP